MLRESKIGCVVVAAGRGTRAQLQYNKVFYTLEDGFSVLRHSLNAFSESGIVDEIVLVLSESDLSAYEALVEKEGHPGIVPKIAIGGSTRQESVISGLSKLSCDTDAVLIHDGARPYVSREIILACAQDALQFGSGVISTPVSDTIKIIDESGFAVETPARETLRAVQTPQAFRYGEILEAHEFCARENYVSTDDAALYERRFGRVKLTECEGAEKNKKLTLPGDFENQSRNMPPFLFRNGTGYDVHRLVEGRKLILCGVEIPFEKGLLGHSDADVALHALMDAMLGACALGDIGVLFPDSDPSYKGISSMYLAEKTLETIKAKGFCLASCDITIVCQRPKLRPYIDTMRENLSRVLGLSVDRISVKATTTEHLGFEGEGLGISAQAVCTVIEMGGSKE